MAKKIKRIEAEIKRMFDLREIGCSYGEIGFELGLEKSTVWRYINSERYKKYYEANKEKKAKYNKEYRQANKEKLNEKKREYRAKKRLSIMIDK